MRVREFVQDVREKAARVDNRSNMRPSAVLVHPEDYFNTLGDYYAKNYITTPGAVEAARVDGMDILRTYDMQRTTIRLVV